LSGPTKFFENSYQHHLNGYYIIAGQLIIQKCEEKAASQSESTSSIYPRTSKEPKPSSKLKRRKNGQVVNIDRKIENRPMNILE
jgi:hypothetical protein